MNTTDNTPADDFEALAVMAGLAGTVTADQTRLLRIITNPAFNLADAADGDTHVEIGDYYAENFSGYAGFDTSWEAEVVADFLRAYYDEQDQMPQLQFGFGCNSGGEMTNFDLGVVINPTDWQNSLTLTESSDLKYLTSNREATGLAAALAYAEALDSTYQSLVAKARRHNLLPARTG